MSSVEAGRLLAFVLALPFPLAFVLAAAGKTERGRRVTAVAYCVLTASINLVLLQVFMSTDGAVRVGSFKLDHLNYPPLLMLNMLTAAVVLYAGLRGARPARSALVTGTLPLVAGTAAVAFLAGGWVAHAVLCEVVTALAVLGLVLHGGGGVRRRLLAFVPWLVSDALFVIAVVLTRVWLKEPDLFIKPPMTSGSEGQVVFIAVLLLLSALVRLGVFPFHFWLKDLLSRADAAWSALLLGTVNFLLVGFRLLVLASLLGRIVASDWSGALLLVGVVSAVAGPMAALLAGEVTGYLSGMYTFQAGVLLTGVAAFSRAGVEASLFCLLVSPLFLTAAVLAAGTFEDLRGSRELHRGGLQAGRAPALFIVFFVSGMSLAGLPPLDGFVGKMLVVVGGMDGAAARPDYAVAAGVTLAGMAVAVIALIRLLGAGFAGGGRNAGSKRPSPGEGAAPLLLCFGSLLFGLFPGVLLRNLVRGGSLILFKTGFTGPGVVFRGTGVAAERVLGSYISWSAPAAAFLLVVSVLTLTLYFTSRPAGSREQSGVRLLPFLGGAGGDHEPEPFLAAHPRPGRRGVKEAGR